MAAAATIIRVRALDRVKRAVTLAFHGQGQRTQRQANIHALQQPPAQVGIVGLRQHVRNGVEGQGRDGHRHQVIDERGLVGAGEGDQQRVIKRLDGGVVVAVDCAQVHGGNQRSRQLAQMPELVQVDRQQTGGIHARQIAHELLRHGCRL